MAAVSRRRFLVAGGTAALGVAASGGPAVAARGQQQAGPEAPEPVLAGSPAQTAAVLPATSPRFDLTDSSDPLFREKPLRNGTVLQSFAFDNVNRRIYVAQVLQGGVQLAEPAPVSGAARSAAGDLCTPSSTSPATNSVTYLLGFGHGVSIGAEPVVR